MWLAGGAFQLDGPLQVLGAGEGKAHIGQVSEDLKSAVEQCLKVSRFEARQWAEAFGWSKTSELFVKNLVPISAVHTGWLFTDLSLF